MGLEFTQVDAFTDRPFTGNPAAVFVLAEPPADWWMQDVAREMNLPETAFVLPYDGGYDLRWFTPSTEVDLCGHATLASAHVLWETGALARNDPVLFDTRSGELRIVQQDGWITMDFPAMPVEECPAPDHLAEALGIEPVWVGKNSSDYLVQVATEKQVRTLQPDFDLLRRIDARGVMVTSEATTNARDFVSRFFAPRVGLDEDPVTGSAHCALAPFWSERLGRRQLTGYQVSSRGGTVRVEAAGDRVFLSGQAVTVLRGALAE